MVTGRFLPGLALCAALHALALAQAPTDVKPGSITYEDVPYPYPVSFLPLTLYGQDVRMAYMDVPPAGVPNGRTIVLFHGMNFGGFYFAGPIECLRRTRPPCRRPATSSTRPSRPTSIAISRMPGSRSTSNTSASCTPPL